MRNRKKYDQNSPSKKRKDDPTQVKAKKHLGQHFLKDESIAKKIGDTLTLTNYKHVLEIGPGMGVLTKYLLLKEVEVVVMELDSESVIYLNHSFPLEHPKLVKDDTFTVIEADFLKFDLSTLFPNKPFAITGNFPYNISTQIVFKVLENKERIPEFTGMFQKEVAKRICEKEGSKAYGILSVLVQAYYEVEYLFTVHPQVFDPPPKVQSGVIRLISKNITDLGCSDPLFFKVVKAGFNQRRKTLRNSLKSLELSDTLKENSVLNYRPEQLSVAQFIELTQLIEKG
ncbi:16S rRNA (adenine(1518)-N(6)/adenine(1519)-N(6))-dimethyltransferase RsmA [Aquimarina sp. ERC-38]|uniref:16S rRNA (adenine(1518)-N(6)/adenine(1519)-N(6))- dimethyltransferase RsmA n=1 Tax=Aquimarina sp. ERC-38 TaxID=2949996 RepID=UPI002247779E|nr:16S rRNA (adenine(1518)-N(6)/adenine(1519)-N(6))-dimethyltransferase RsmA [Aquimarina sp. ERC-38]UZO81345.1 16S rRNA (adenine(1518)-N(6)/adenine(1519)-N(6))-dimethyltransferase RsmA [Aquimarina sp. ERC-38]